ncbi:hypothetical protein DRN87_01850 [Candidatus Geothermarchaeota archaeon]|nr:MAG: hypothetical protein DRN87_01850 [Candidatus Geothermarchaeota archaeon]HEW93964.1 ArsR family transcriptional regulator [Thermoprotei archaeon]
MSELRGTTLKVYLYLIKSGKNKIGVRELMRELGMKSPSHAYYHLDKLVSMGLLEKKYGDYYLVKNVKIDYLKDFIFIGKGLVPKFLFYTVFFLIIFIYGIMYPRIFELYYYITIISSAMGVIISLYETISAYKKLKI